MQQTSQKRLDGTTAVFPHREGTREKTVALSTSFNGTAVGLEGFEVLSSFWISVLQV